MVSKVKKTAPPPIVKLDAWKVAQRVAEVERYAAREGMTVADYSAGIE